MQCTAQYKMLKINCNEFYNCRASETGKIKGSSVGGADVDFDVEF